MYSRKINSKHISDYNADEINAFFEQYGAIIDHRQIKPENTWNMDKSGQQLSETGREKVIAEAEGQNNAKKTEPPRTKWNTVLKCISADREKIDPLMIFSD